MTIFCRVGEMCVAFSVALTLIGCNKGTPSTPDTTSDSTATTSTVQSTRVQMSSSAAISTTAQIAVTTPTTTETTVDALVSAEHVSLTFRLERIHFDTLVSNSSLLVSFKKGVQDAIAKEAGADILSDHVVVSVVRVELGNSASLGFLSPGGGRRLENATAVYVLVDVLHPDGANEVVLRNLGSGSNASQAVVSFLEQTPGIDQVLQRPVEIQVVRRPSRVTFTQTMVSTTAATDPEVLHCAKAWPLQGGRSCSGSSADSVWKWMGDHSFGMGPTYHNTNRPDINYSQVPHGMCIQFGCVSDWKYQQTKTKATLQCRDGRFVVDPRDFQQDDDYRCTPTISPLP